MPSRRTHSSIPTREEQQQALRAVGAELRSARLARDEDLADIAAYLRIRSSFLEGLEAGEIGAAPGRPYALGFLRSYAEHLGIDTNRLLDTVKVMAGPMPLSPRPARSTPSSEARLPAGTIFALSLILLAAVTIGYRTYDAASDERPAPVADGVSDLGAIDPATKAADVTAVLAAEAAPPAVLVSSDGETALAPDLAAHDGRLVLVARANGWIRLSSADQKIVRSGVLAAGDRVVLPDRFDLKLSTGNAGDVEILLDGRSLGLLGAPGELVRDLAMDPDALGGRLGQPH